MLFLRPFQDKARYSIKGSRFSRRKRQKSVLTVVDFHGIWWPAEASEWKERQIWQEKDRSIPEKSEKRPLLFSSWRSTSYRNWLPASCFLLFSLECFWFHLRSAHSKQMTPPQATKPWRLDLKSRCRQPSKGARLCLFCDPLGGPLSLLFLLVTAHLVHLEPPFLCAPPNEKARTGQGFPRTKSETLPIWLAFSSFWERVKRIHTHILDFWLG